MSTQNDDKDACAFDARDLCQDVRAQFADDERTLVCWYFGAERALAVDARPSLVDDAVRVARANHLVHTHTTTYHNVAHTRAPKLVPVMLIVLERSADDDANAERAPLDPLAAACNYTVHGGSVVAVKHECFACRRPTSQLCSGCARALYCSPVCQRADLRRHRAQCGDPGRVVRSAPPPANAAVDGDDDGELRP